MSDSLEPILRDELGNDPAWAAKEIIGQIEAEHPERTVAEILLDAREALDKEQAAVALILRSKDDVAVVTLDVMGQITAVSRHSAGLLGRSPKELIGAPIDMVLERHMDVPVITGDEMTRAEREDKPVHSVRSHRRSDGTGFEADHVVIALVGLRGELRGFVREIRDRTQLDAHELKIAR